MYRTSFSRPAALVAGIMLLLPLTAPADDWSLMRSAARALEVSPALSGTRAAVTSRQGELSEAGRWPNPHIEITAGDKLGRETGSGGWQGQEYAFSQPIPIGGRLGEQRRAATRELAAAQAAILAAMLEVEYHTATTFHQLQWARGQVALAQSQRQRAREFRHIAARRAAAGDLSPREDLRLELLAAEAEAALEDATREETAARIRLLNLLGLPADQPLELSRLTPPGEPPPLDMLRRHLADHPALRASRERVEAASARTDAAQAARIPDLELRLAREEDYFDGRREAAYSIGIQVELPLWSTGRGRVDASRGEAVRTRAEHQLRGREQEGALEESHARLSRLRARTTRHESQVLDPAERVLTMTGQGYSAGELGLAELIDATQTQWRANREHLELMHQARQQEAQLRLAAGLLLTNPTGDGE